MTYAEARQSMRVARLNHQWFRKTSGYRHGFAVGAFVAGSSIAFVAGAFLVILAALPI